MKDKHFKECNYCKNTQKYRNLLLIFLREEMERMREHIYNEIDRNKDMMIDYSEFAQGLEDKKDIDKNWETIDNEPVFDDKDFNSYEKKRIDEIREDIAEGKKPEGYEFRDVPLLDDNFLNETHIR